MAKNIFRKSLITFLTIILVSAMIPLTGFNAEGSTVSASEVKPASESASASASGTDFGGGAAQQGAALKSDGYRSYLLQYEKTEKPRETVPVDLSDVESSKDSVLEQIQGSNVQTIKEGGYSEFSFHVTQTGLYQMQCEYYPVKGRGTEIEMELMLDQKVPFSEARFCTFFRVWKDKTKPGEVTDSRGNDLTPGQYEAPSFQKVSIQDNTGVFNEPYSFYLSEGDHTIRLTSSQEAIAIKAITFQNPEPLLPYAELKKEYEKAGYKKSTVSLEPIEAEQCYAKAESVLYARTDRSSPLTTPYSPSKIKTNIIGGTSWSSPGQWIEWKVNVSEAGLYRIDLRAKQNQLSGSFVTRKLYIDGAVPCKELSDIRVNYSMIWQNIEIPYDLYLSVGEHTLRLEASIGALSDTVAEIANTVYQLNYAYRKIVMITGVTPDVYRDYMLVENVPEVFEIFKEQIQILEECDANLLRITGKRGSMNSILQTLTRQLKELTLKPEKIQKRLSSLKNNIGALGTWLINIKQQSLALDKIYIHSPDENIPKAEGNVMERAIHESEIFFYSFIEDYNVIGDYAKGNQVIDVWVQTGRDQANIIKDLLTNDFNPELSDGINLKLVQGQLLQATAAGKGPDVVLQVAGSEPVNYAIRGANYDLTSFKDFEEVSNRFRPSALVPYNMNGEIYALPETQTYQMLFYRTDIFEELGLVIPDNWSETFTLIGRLQKKNMTMGIQPPNSIVGNFNALSSMAMFLYQNGGELYIDGNTKSGLKSEAAEEAFKTWISLYIDYKLPTKYDAMNRFRTGEMPIMIEDFTMFNILSVAAPEIRGMWDFAPVPATVRKDGTLDRSVPSTGLGCMMLSDTINKEGAWEFMKWWTSAEVQSKYGREIENQLGISARYPTANVEAFNNMAWSVKEREMISSQWKNVKGIPEVPGGYFTSRHLNNAFRRVLTYNEDPKETLLDYVKNIDAEIEAKYKELGLDKRSGK